MDDRPTRFLPHLAALSATSVTLIYTFGFLIVTIHLGRHGVFLFNPFKPKVFLTGTIFVLLVAIPAFGFLKFPLLGVQGAKFPGAKEIKFLGRYKLAWAISWYMFSLGLAFFASNYILAVPTPQLFDSWWWLLLFPAFVGCTILERYYFDRFWYLFIIAEIAISGTAFFRLFQRRHETSIYGLTNWFFVVTVVAFWGYEIIKDGSWKQIRALEQYPFFLIGLFFFYESSVYPNLKTELGGGSLSPVVLYFSSTVPISSANSGQFFLVEETDQGFYVVMKPEEKDCYFVRRDLVSAIKYGK